MLDTELFKQESVVASDTKHFKQVNELKGIDWDSHTLEMFIKLMVSYHIDNKCDIKKLLPNIIGCSFILGQNHNDLEKRIRDLMIANIQLVLNDEVTTVDLLFCRPDDIITYIESIGGEDLDDLDTNSWQWDYWLRVTHKGNKYQVTGNGYYSNNASFSKVEE